MRAVVEENLEKVKKLVSEGNSPNINDNHGNTPLHVAIIRNLPEIVDYLLTLEEINVDNRNFYGETALFHAVKRGHLHLVDKLVKANSDVNLANSEDITPLHISVRHPKIAHFLIRNGANINAMDYSGESPLHVAVTEVCVETVCMLLYYNADADIGCSNNVTPFMRSIMRENLDLQEMLLDYVVDFNAATKDFVTILHLALTHTCPYVKEIIARGADVNYGQTANAFLSCLNVPDADKFRLIWKDLQYQRLCSNASYLEVLIHNLQPNEIYRYLRIIIDSGNLAPIFEGFDFFPLYNLLDRGVDNRKEWLQITSELICLYLCYGNVLNCEIIYQLYKLFGYSELLYICLHMDILQSTYINVSIASILYSTKLSIGTFKQLVSDCIQGNMTPIKQFLPYIRINRPLNFNYIERDKHDYETLFQIPSLLELSRNRTRDYLVHKFSLYTSKQYYLFVQNLPICSVYKNILTFRKPVYDIQL